MFWVLLKAYDVIYNLFSFAMPKDGSSIYFLGVRTHCLNLIYMVRNHIITFTEIQKNLSVIGLTSWLTFVLSFGLHIEETLIQ